MASVTKTITEVVGEIQQTTSLYFASFEDFMEYERVVNSEEGASPINIVIEDGPKECDPRRGGVSKGEEDRAALTKLEVGKQYVVVKDISDHYHDIGDIVTVVYNDDDLLLPYQTEDSYGNRSWIKPEEVGEI